MTKRSIRIFGHETSLSLEDEFWEELRSIAFEQKITITKLLEQIDNKKTGNLSSALRLFVLKYMKEKS